MRASWLIGGVLLLLLISQRQSIMNFISPWKQKPNAALYLPRLRSAEVKYGLPEDLLARIAYQESRWRDDIVSGAKKSAAGAVGLMQIVPKWHPTVNPLDVSASIDYAAKYLRDLYQQFGSWKLAVAAYNAGPGNVRKYGGIPPFDETQTYIKEVFGDLLAAVPVVHQGMYA